jgi:hypothetical protein
VASWSKESIQGREKYAAWNGDVLAGYLWVRDGFVSPHTGNNILYIETMAATPTNLETAVWDPCLKHVGLALLGYATFQSQRRGYNGVFGLHAADDVAEGFYRHVDQQIGSVFRPDRTGVKGVDPRAQQNESKLYFETTDNGGLAILEGFRHG